LDFDHGDGDGVAAMKIENPVEYSAQSILRRRQIAALICEMRETAAQRS
jgi:hypothetical protein